jgi:molybdate transport system ATP-binding protein
MRRVLRADSTYIEPHLERVSLARNARTILREISWVIRPGERWVLAGGNGAGKTQLLKLVSGDVWPTPGATGPRYYRWRHERWDTPFEIKNHIAYVGAERQDKYERYGWNHSVEQIVGTGLYHTDIPLDPLLEPDRRRIARLLERLGIEALTARPFLSLSYGERRLVLLARALASRPKLLLLDELLNGLDELNRGRALRWLQHTTGSRMPWVLTTHRPEDVPDSVTHALVLEGGRTVYRGRKSRAALDRWLGISPRDPARTRVPPRARRSAGRPLVQLKQASVYLDDTSILQDISLAVRRRECWVVHGRNGSGKTTLLRTLYGDHGVAAGGHVERAGISPGVPLQTFKTRVGLVAPHLQADHSQELTVAEVVQSGRHASIGLNDPPTAADRAAARRALAFLQLTRLAPRTVRELSYGQLRRVLFARAWVRRPRLLLLDEPFAGVDGPTRRQLSERIEAMVIDGAAVVMATHHRAEWPRCTTHELELSAGRVRYCGPVRSAFGGDRQSGRGSK